MRSYVMEMRRQGHRVLLLYYTSADADPSIAATETDTYFIPHLLNQCAAKRSWNKKVLNKLKDFFVNPSQKMDRVERYFKRDFSWLPEVIDEAIGQTKYDIVQVDFPWMMPAVNHLPVTIPRVFVSHEAQFVMLRREGKAKLAQRSAIAETYLAAKYSAVLALTDVEAEAWRIAVPNINVQVSVMGVELPEHAKEITHQANKLVFIGSGNHFPNLEGLKYFLTEVWPIVIGQHPNIELHITGKYKDDYVQGFADCKGIKWRGFVPDLAELLHGAISIVPIRHGSGIRVKILESMALGAPVVSTPMAVEGIAAKQPAEILLANDAEAFALAIGKLLTDGKMYEQIATNAQVFVNKYYNLEIATQQRVDIFNSLIA